MHHIDTAVAPSSHTRHMLWQLLLQRRARSEAVHKAIVALNFKKKSVTCWKSPSRTIPWISTTAFLRQQQQQQQSTLPVCSVVALCWCHAEKYRLPLPLVAAGNMHEFQSTRMTAKSGAAVR